jgi:hypothetical protein
MDREFLRHTVAALAYRGGKTLRDAPEGFPVLRISDQTRTPLEILAHISDLLQWALWLAKGQHVWNESVLQPWESEVARFFQKLQQLDAYLAGDSPLGFAPQKLFQGPIADALTHVGQIAMLRRLAGAPIRGENYFKADIVAGRLGKDQSSARVEFE